MKKMMAMLLASVMAAGTFTTTALVRMPVMQRPAMKNFCFPNGSMSISLVEPRRMM